MRHIIRHKGKLGQSIEEVGQEATAIVLAAITKDPNLEGSTMEVTAFIRGGAWVFKWVLTKTDFDPKGYFGRHFETLRLLQVDLCGAMTVVDAAGQA